jgi:DNA-binding NarL/FixJ family response regulator
VGILENERVVLESLTQSLSQAGLEVSVAASDAPSFLSAVALAPPPLAIVDLALGPRPGAEPEGFEVLRSLRTTCPQTQVVILSASTGTDQVERSYREGAAGYLFKASAGLDDLVSVCRAAERGERVFPMQAFGDLHRVPSQPPPRSGLLSRLTSREREVLALIGAGHDNLKIAALLDIGERTVKTYVGALYRKLHVENRVQLALIARQGASEAQQ